MCAGIERLPNMLSVPSVSEGAAPQTNAALELASSIQSTNILSRTTTRRNFEGAATITPGSPYIVHFPNLGHALDLSACSLRFAGVTCTMTAGVQPRFMQGPLPIIQTAILRAGGATIATLQQASLYMQIQHTLYGDPSAQGSSAMGIGTAATRQTWSTVSRVYEIPFSLLFGDLATWPSSFGLLEMELHFADAAAPLEATGATTTPTWSASGTASYVQVDVLTFKQPISWDAIRFRNARVSQFTVAAATTSADLVVSHRLRNMRSLIVVERATATLTTVTTLNRLENFLVNAKSGWQGIVDNVHYPPYRVLFTAATDYYEAYKQILLANNHRSGADPTTGAISDVGLMSPEQWSGNDPSGIAKNVVVVSFERSDNASGILSGVDTRNNGSDTRLSVEWTAGATVASTLTGFVIHDSVIRSSGGVLTLED